MNELPDAPVYQKHGADRRVRRTRHLDPGFVLGTSRNDWSPRHHRPRVAHGPTAGLHQRNEAFDHFVEQCRLFQIEHVARLRKHRKSGGRQVFLQKQARFDARIVLVAADDKCRRRHFGDGVGHGVDRGSAALETAHRVGGTPGIVAPQCCVEVGMAARVFHQERNPARRLTRRLGDLDRADCVVLVCRRLALPAEGVEVLKARSGADAGQRHRQGSLRRVERDLQR
jgi:hypothetical protein